MRPRHRELAHAFGTMVRALSVAVTILISTGLQAAPEVKIATFNIENLGKTKVSKPAILKYLATTVRKFDIVAVQEVSDISEKAPQVFLTAINANGGNYGLLLSERTGTHPSDRTSQEQYAFYFDKNVVEAIGDGAIFDDKAGDLFQREPYTARFKVKGTEFGFAITQVHTQPTNALSEIKALYKVHQALSPNANHIILGDFNGSCTYAKPQELAALELRGPTFFWVVPDDADTTVSPNTHCAYDRVVLTKSLKNHFVQWGVANWFTDDKYSDHWPVWFSLKSALQYSGVGCSSFRHPTGVTTKCVWRVSGRL